MSKKGFKVALNEAVNPARAFVSAPGEGGGAMPFTPEKEPEIVPVLPGGGTVPRATMARAEKGEETKSVRMQLLVKPSVVSWLKLTARDKGVSVNAFIGALFEREMKKGGK